MNGLGLLLAGLGLVLVLVLVLAGLGLGLLGGVVQPRCGCGSIDSSGGSGGGCVLVFN